MRVSKYSFICIKILEDLFHGGLLGRPGQWWEGTLLSCTLNHWNGLPILTFEEKNLGNKKKILRYWVKTILFWNSNPLITWQSSKFLLQEIIRMNKQLAMEIEDGHRKIRQLIILLIDFQPWIMYLNIMKMTAQQKIQDHNLGWNTSCE